MRLNEKEKYAENKGNDYTINKDQSKICLFEKL